MACLVEFYVVERGTSPAFEFLTTLPPRAQAKLLRVLGLLEAYGPSLREPYVKRLTGWPGLLELRTSVGSDAFRLFFFFAGQDVAVVVHGIRKKSERTPARDLSTADARRKDYMRRH
ncbi:MAG TPA: type II toxin-antitoxin system RelE/ParE family toxin [Dehalococcoidia bacterium]|nr:type II toxin-antitoxin system RelE/ParE family toxin [Dehalococcoidia bacterium]